MEHNGIANATEERLRGLSPDELLDRVIALEAMVATVIVTGKALNPYNPSLREAAYAFGAESTEQAKQAIVGVMDRIQEQVHLGGFPRYGKPPARFI